MNGIDRQRLRGRLGEGLAVCDRIEITQARIDQFAAATGDRQWIHLDSSRAAAESLFGSTIAAEFLTLSLVSVMTRSAMSRQAPKATVPGTGDHVRIHG